VSGGVGAAASALLQVSVEEDATSESRLSTARRPGRKKLFK